MKGNALAAIAVLLLIGCGGGDSGIGKLQVGTGAPAEGFAGQPLPVVAAVTTKAAIAQVTVDIRPVTGQGWTFSKPYTDEVVGSKEMTFRTAIDVPTDAEPGNYQLTLRVTTADSIAIAASADFRLDIDSTVPTTTDLDVGINAAGDDLHLETELAAPSKIKQVSVAVEGEQWRKEFSFAGKALVGQLSAHFHEHVHVADAPRGAYRVILTVTDEQGRQAKTEARFSKK